MATNLVHEQDSEQFRVYDPPNLPTKPSFPNVAVLRWRRVSEAVWQSVSVFCS